MKTRSILKGAIAVLSVFLCAEIGFLIYQINTGTIAYARNLDLGNKYLLSEDYDSAISAFSKAIEIDAMNADAYIGRGDAYKGKGDYASAWKDYEKAQELSANTDILRDKIGVTEMTVVSEEGEGVDGAAVTLTGSGHSYEFMTDNTGFISEVIFPEEYNMKIAKENYEPVEIELSAEEGGSFVGQIQLRSEINDAIGNEEDSTMVEDNDGVIDLYDYRYSNIWQLADIAGDLYPGSGDSIVLWNHNMTIATSGFDKEETTYIMFEVYSRYSLAGIRINDPIGTAEERVLALGFELYENRTRDDGSLTSFRRYKRDDEYIHLDIDSSGGFITRISWNYIDF